MLQIKAISVGERGMKCDATTYNPHDTARSGGGGHDGLGVPPHALEGGRPWQRSSGGGGDHVGRGQQLLRLSQSEEARCHPKKIGRAHV